MGGLLYESMHCGVCGGCSKCPCIVAVHAQRPVTLFVTLTSTLTLTQPLTLGLGRRSRLGMATTAPSPLLSPRPCGSGLFWAYSGRAPKTILLKLTRSATAYCCFLLRSVQLRTNCIHYNGSGTMSQDEITRCGTNSQSH